MSEWISVEDGAPFSINDMERNYDEKTVIVCTRFGDVFPEEFRCGKGIPGSSAGPWCKFGDFQNGYITHWMPLPEPPK